MADALVVGVPVEDRADLVGLLDTISGAGQPVENRFFDGVAFVESVVPLVTSGAAWAVLRTWIKARADVRKATRVAFRGVEITAMNAADVERIVKIIGESQDLSDE